jgi:site-specific DNA recombinase
MTSTLEPRRKVRADTGILRVAIYTRQSVERAGDQALTSIDAQRAQVEAFVASQAGLGWRALPERYDDHGYSGATLARPAFKRLLDEVRAGRIDLIVTYRMDRLSRSQRDFLNLMHLFDEHGVRWVSATESFSTARPEGRAMLSVLMAFAQMEREVTSERVRDKTAASRERGLWTGGKPMLGYDSRDGRLVVNAAEAEVVRGIFRLYLDVPSVADLVGEVAARGWRNKAWTNRLGAPTGGRPLVKATLRTLLASPLYVGLVRRGTELRSGKHEPIIDRLTWDTVQTKLAVKAPRTRRPHRSWTTLLGGLIFCGCGTAMVHHYTSRHGRQYHFYLCGKHVRERAAACPGSRVRMDELDAFVLDRLHALGRDRALVASTVAAAHTQAQAGTPVDEDELRRLLAELTPLWDVLQLAERQRVLQLLIERVTYTAATHDVALTLRDSGVRTIARELERRAEA